MIKAIIFDMDGVIVDTEKYHEKAYQKVSRRLGFSLTDREVLHFKGVTAPEIFYCLFRKHKIKRDAEKYALLKDKVYRSYLKNLKALPGVINFINQLKKVKVKIAIASSGSRLNVNFILKKLRLRRKFNAVVNGDQVKKGKPNPEIFLKAARKMKVKPKECVVIEDSVSGIKAAKRAGMFCIGVTTTLNRKYLKETDLIVDSLSQIKL